MQTPASPTTQTLKIWYQVLHDSVRAEGPDLSTRQMTILLAVYLIPEPWSVRNLARDLKLTKPPVTRALKTLEAHGFIRRSRDPKDKRNLVIRKTVAGAIYLSEFSTYIREALREAGREHT